MAINQWARPAISVLPFLYRLLQCLRRYKDNKDTGQLLNAGKYCTAIFVSTFSALRSNLASPAFFGMWLGCIIISTAYTYSWDVRRDWGLGSKKNKLLRNKLMFPFHWVRLQRLI